MNNCSLPFGFFVPKIDEVFCELVLYSKIIGVII